MIFNGFPIGFAMLLTTIGGGVIIASHFLKIRQKNLEVPTVLFWRQAIKSSRRNILFGKLSAMKTLLFLLGITLLMIACMLSPITKPLKKTIVVLDTSNVTDLPQAQKHARTLLQQSDRGVLMTVGDEIRVLGSLTRHSHAALAAVDTVEVCRSPYSGLSQAVKEAKAADPEAQIVVLTGQQMTPQKDIRVITCASGQSVLPVVLKIYFLPEYAEPARAYCHADNRFDYCSDREQADVVLETLPEDLMKNWRTPRFVEQMSQAVEAAAGLRNRPVALAAQITDNIDNQPGYALRWNLTTGLMAVLVCFLLLEIRLVTQGKLI